MSSGDCYHPALLPLSWLFGKWESTEAEVSYPTMSAVKYKEVLEIQPSEKPIIQYQSNTWHLEKKHKMHSEMGFFRIRPGTKEVALIASHNFGVAEVSEGEIEENFLRLESKSLSRMSFTESASVVKIVREWSLKSGILNFVLLMETSKHPLQTHLVCSYCRI
ncbi:uncharacterized protein LOC129217701 isoform X1 [Uloborus diversus]|uniref:uncharacterized protein LOC129217701 isoform X1 n=1 Tax=Uloborus diversus TaxID=327109 RepID=UPI00240A5103|nr:uncharacterized protein LOC129217701 isoform X1 [Uloborus diversus]